MEGHIDSHQWASKMETHCLISGKPDLEIEPDARLACEEPFISRLLQSEQAKIICALLKSQVVCFKKLLSKKAHFWRWGHPAESITGHHFIE